MDLVVSNLPLFFSAMLMVVVLTTSTKEKLGFTKNIIISVIRTAIQPVAADYLLKHVFQVNSLILTLIMVLMIVSNAAFNAKKRSQQLQEGFSISFIAIGCSTGVTIGVSIFFDSIRFIPSQIVPISGMVASSSIVAIGPCYRDLDTLFQDRRQAVMEKLALGITIKLTSLPIIQQSVRTGMAPTINSAKTVGIVNLPGMMSGLVFAGVDPIYVIEYQIMMTFMLLSATSIGSVIATCLAYKGYYSQQK